jgi:hypothetical protein
VGKLSYSNVTATIALFVALSAGAYAAVSLDNNSVKSKHIKDGQVKDKDLAESAKILDFSFAEIPDSPSQEILDAGGYQLIAECDTNNNRPELNVNMQVPETGTMDLALLSDKGSGEPAPGLASIPVVADTPFALIHFSSDTNGQSVIGAGPITYSTEDGAATMNMYARADDGIDACTMNGTITPAP